MAGSHRASSQSLTLLAELAENPYKFEFFQALRLLEAMHPEQPGLGRTSRASQDPILLGQEPSLAFATSMLAGFEPAREGHKGRLDVLFFGLFGPNGPMPLHLTEYARDRDRQEHDPTMRRFADVFHHRMLSLFYRAWADAQPTVAFDRPEQSRFFDYVGSLFGLGAPGSRDHDELPDHARLYLAGLLGLQTRPAVGLEAALEEYLSVPTSIEEFSGEWLELPDENRLYLGRSARSGRLGVNTTAGGRTWYCQGLITVVCGPLAFADFRRLLPDRDSLPRVRGLIRTYAGDELRWELRLVLRASDVPSVALGETGELGWTSWLGTRSSPTDADDVLIRPAVH